MSKKELFKNLLIFTQGSLMISMTKLGEFLETSSSKYCKVHSELKQFERFNSHLPARIIQLEYNAVTNSQYSRRETIKLKHGSAERKDVLEENICKVLLLTGVNIIPDGFHCCHHLKRLDRVIAKLKSCKHKQSIMFNCKNLRTKYLEINSLNFWEDFLLVKVYFIKISSLYINPNNLWVPERCTLPGFSVSIPYKCIIS